MEWHSGSIESVFRKLDTGERGLPQAEAEKRLVRFGRNVLEFGRGRSFLSIFAAQFKNPFIIVLLIAGAISFFLSHGTDAAVIALTVLLNVAIGFYQEGKAEKAFVSLRRALQETAYVVREGRELLVPRETVVPGDIIVVRPGDKVPADIRLVDAKDVFVDESMLTGEWTEAKKGPEELPSKTNLLHRTNILFAGTLVTRGRGRGVVVSTGRTTELGKIADLVTGMSETKTPLEKELGALSFMIGALTVAVVGSLFAVGVFFRNANHYDMFLSSVALAVAAVPEGLAISVTIVMAIGMQRIFQKQALVRHPFAAQTLGSVSVIATDKTGTLTEGSMQVACLLTGMGELLHGGLKSDRNLPLERESSHALLLRIALLLSEAEIENSDAALEELRMHGNPTEKALVFAAHEAGFRRDAVLKEFPRLDFAPFDSRKKFSVALHRDEGAQKNVIYLLGTPEIVIDASSKIQLDGANEEFRGGKHDEIVRHTEDLAKKGLRVLAVGYRFTADAALVSDPGPFSGFVFVGLVALRDPLRKDAAEAVRVAQEAGIDSVLVTGDHLLTGVAIAHEVGLFREGGGKHRLLGEELDRLSPEDLERRVEEIDIYARVTPEQKLRIIEAWQKKGAVIAMTGDGVNDAPALRRADIGVALGEGTDLAREASDIVLMDNSFSGLVTAIKEGRVIFENIRKILIFLFNDAFAETILVATSVLLGLPLPLLPGQILWVNLVEDSLPNATLAFEGGDDTVMKEPPSKFRRIFDRSSFLLTVLFGAVTTSVILGFYFWFLWTGKPLAYIQTMTFLFVGIDSLFSLFSLRNFYKPIWRIPLRTNPTIVPAVVIGLLMLVVAVHMPFFQTLLHTTSLEFRDWALVFGYGFVAIGITEVLKFFLFYRR